MSGAEHPRSAERERSKPTEIRRPERAVRPAEIERIRESGGGGKRAVRALEGFSDHDFQRPIRTSNGVVRIASANLRTDGEVCWVDIQLGTDPGEATESGETHVRIFNPPLLVADPNGEIERGDRRFRVDPVAAIAEAIAGAGGRIVGGVKR